MEGTAGPVCGADGRLETGRVAARVWGSLLPPGGRGRSDLLVGRNPKGPKLVIVPRSILCGRHHPGSCGPAPGREGSGGSDGRGEAAVLALLAPSLLGCALGWLSPTVSPPSGPTALAGFRYRCSLPTQGRSWLLVISPGLFPVPCWLSDP